MPICRALAVVSLLFGAACSGGPSLRVLSSEPALGPRPEPEPPRPSLHDSPTAPSRIGPPGGSGVGARSVVPALW